MKTIKEILEWIENRIEQEDEECICQTGDDNHLLSMAAACSNLLGELKYFINE